MTVTTPSTPGPLAGATAGVSARRRRAVLGGGAVVVGLAATAAVVVLRSHGDARAPYADPAVRGRLTLCVDGSAVTEGSVARRPFVDAVVGPGADAGGGRATLLAHQPREGVDPEEWTGVPLTAGTTVAGGAAPAARLDTGSTTLAQFLGGYPAVWDGWVQLRLAVAGSDGATSDGYAAVDLRVEGDRWHAVAAGSATCPS